MARIQLGRIGMVRIQMTRKRMEGIQMERINSKNTNGKNRESLLALCCISVSIGVFRMKSLHRKPFSRRESISRRTN